MRRRRKDHESHALRNPNTLFLRALGKYGSDAFVWKIIMECKDEDDLNESEVASIIGLKTRAPNGYNLSKGGEGGCSVSLSEEHKIKLSLSRKGKSTWMKGKKHTEETKRKIRRILNSSEMKEKKRQIALDQWKTKTRQLKQSIAMMGNTNGKGNEGWKKTYEKRWGKKWKDKAEEDKVVEELKD